MRDRTCQLKRLHECQTRLEREAAEATSEGRHAEEAAIGQKKRARKPKAPDAAADTTAKTNVTDLDSRIMKTPRGYVHGYNAQAVVTADQIIVAADVTQEAHDIKQLYPLLAQTQAQLHAIEYPPPIGTALADAGSGSAEANPTDPALLLATNKDGQPVKKGARDLRDPNDTTRFSDSLWFWRVSEGIPKTKMKAWKQLLSEEQIWQAMAYEHQFSHGGKPAEHTDCKPAVSSSKCNG